MVLPKRTSVVHNKHNRGGGVSGLNDKQDIAVDRTQPFHIPVRLPK